MAEASYTRRRPSALERRVLTRYPADVDDDQVAELERVPVQTIRRIRGRSLLALEFADFDALMRANRGVPGL